MIKLNSMPTKMSTACLTCIFILMAVTSLPVDSQPSTVKLETEVDSESRDAIFEKPKNFVKVRLEEGKTRFTEDEKKLILQIHNSYRSLVDPPATDMRELEWDKDLEEYASNHTQSCTGAHSGGRMTKKWTWRNSSWVDWYNMGENLYYSHGSWYSIEEAMWMFWNEGKDYDIDKMTCTRPGGCGHYQVLTTAKSYRVGCALNLCASFTASRYKTPATFLACNYADAPFYTNARPYTVGKSCSDCTYKKQGTTMFIYCGHNLCVGPNSFFFKTGFNGDTSVVRGNKTLDTVQPTPKDSPLLI